MSNEPDTRMSDAIKTNSPLTMFITMRDILAERLDVASPRDTSGIARQLERIIQIVAELESGTKVTDDKIAAFFAEEWKAESM